MCSVLKGKVASAVMRALSEGCGGQKSTIDFTHNWWMLLLRYNVAGYRSKCGDHILYILDVELTCSGCLGEISVSWRKERVGEYIGDGEKQTDWLSQDRTSSEGESCGRE